MVQIACMHTVLTHTNAHTYAPTRVDTCTWQGVQHGRARAELLPLPALALLLGHRRRRGARASPCCCRPGPPPSLHPLSPSRPLPLSPAPVRGGACTACSALVPMVVARAQRSLAARPPISTAQGAAQVHLQVRRGCGRAATAARAATCAAKCREGSLVVQGDCRWGGAVPLCAATMPIAPCRHLCCGAGARMGMALLLQHVQLLYVHTARDMHVHHSCTRALMDAACTSPTPHLHFTCTSLAHHLRCTYTSLALHLHFTCTSQALHLSCTCTSLAHHLRCTCTSPALYLRFTCTSHAFHLHLTCTSPAPHLRFTSTSPVLHQHFTCTSRALLLRYTCASIALQSASSALRLHFTSASLALHSRYTCATPSLTLHLNITSASLALHPHFACTALASHVHCTCISHALYFHLTCA